MGLPVPVPPPDPAAYPSGRLYRLLQRLLRVGGSGGTRVGYVAAGVAVLWIALGRLDALLAGMTSGTAGEVSGGVSRLASLGSNGSQLLDTWSAWSADAAGAASPGVLLRTYAIFDVAMALGYGLLLAYIVSRLYMRIAPKELLRPEPPDGVPVDRWRQAIDSAGLSSAPGWIRPLAGIAFLVVALVTADLVENVMLLFAFDTDLNVVAGNVLRFAHVAKLLVMGLLGLTLVYVSLAAPQARMLYTGQTTTGPHIRALLRGARAQRLSLIIVGLLGVIFLSSVADQGSDLVLQWGWLQAPATLLLAGLLSGMIWVVATFASSYATSPVSPLPWLQNLTRRIAVVVLGVILLGLLITGFTSFPGVGLAVPILVAGILWVVGKTLPAEIESEPPPTPDVAIPPSFPALMASLVIALTGLGIVRAATPTLIDGAALLDAVQRVLPFPADSALGELAPGLLLVAALVVLAMIISIGASMWTRLATTLVGSASDPLVVWVRRIVIGSPVVLVALMPIVLPLDAPQIPVWSLLLLGSGVTFAAVPVFDRIRTTPDTEPTETPPETRFYLLASLGAMISRQEQPLWARLAAPASIMASLLWVAATIWMNPLDAAPRIGAIGLLFVALIAFVLWIAGAVTLVHFTGSPKVLRLIGIRRAPVFTLLAVWILIVAAIPAITGSGFHDVRLAEPTELTNPVPGGPAECLDDNDDEIRVGDVFDRWLCRNGLPARQTLTTAPRPDDGRQAVPMVFVSAWGGGIRAAVWTGLVLDCLFEANLDNGCDAEDRTSSFDRSDLLFAASGISGGSLGIIEYVAFLTEKSRSGTNDEWVRNRLHHDYLSPALGRLLMTDMLLGVLGGGGGRADRAAILEQAWEGAWGEEGQSLLAQGLFGTWRSNAHVPLVVANGASVHDACRVNASVLSAATPRPAIDDNPAINDCTSLDPFIGATGARPDSLVGTHDLTTFLCDDMDVRLSTAALLSARFPVVSPSGRLRTPDCAATEQFVDVVDGGNLELSGALTASQLWNAVEPLVEDFNAASPDVCIVPVMVHIENGYSPSQQQELTPAQPNQWKIPGLNLRHGLVHNARAAAALPFATPTVPFAGATAGEQVVATDGSPEMLNRYAFVTTRSHPGVQAPLGWTLSDQAIDSLSRQLSGNHDELKDIKRWFDESLRCVTTSD